jgi:hypothetical protein
MIDARQLLVALTFAVASPLALAAPCGGFTDVDDTSPDTSPFCPNVQWIKNRSITLGCTSSTLYCPNDNVTRLTMAAFMNRLGTALTPVQLRVDTAPGAVDLDANAVVCQTADYAVAGFPRRAFVDLALAAMSTFDTNVGADLVKSTNGGASWTVLTTLGNRGFVPANRWGTLSNVAATDLAVGETVRFGVQMSRGGLPGTSDLADSRCQLRAALYSRDGAAPPY